MGAVESVQQWEALNGCCQCREMTSISASIGIYKLSSPSVQSNGSTKMILRPIHQHRLKTAFYKWATTVASVDLFLSQQKSACEIVIPSQGSHN